MKTAAAILLVLLVPAIAQAQQWEHSYDVPSYACANLTLRDCTKLSKDLGINDDTCYKAHWLEVRPDFTGYTVDDCLKMNAQLREFLRQRLDGTLATIPPPPPTELEQKMAQQFPNKWVLPDGTPVPRAEMACVDANGVRACVALPSNQELDAPALP